MLQGLHPKSLFFKKILKSYQNPIDNRLTVWYNLHEIKKGA